MAVWLFERVKCLPLSVFLNSWECFEKIREFFFFAFSQWNCPLKMFVQRKGTWGGEKITPAVEQSAFVHLQTLRLALTSSGLTWVLKNAEKPMESHYLMGRDCAFHFQTTSQPPQPPNTNIHTASPIHCHFHYSCGNVQFVMNLKSTERACQ